MKKPVRNLIIAIVVIVILGGGYFIFVKGKSTTTSSSTSSQASSSTTDNCPNAPTATAATTITYTNTGFTPSVVSVTAGGKLTVKNDSGTDLQFDSNPHPIHTDDTDLNINAIANGDEKTVTVNKTGCFGYHNHFKPADGGWILIK